MNCTPSWKAKLATLLLSLCVSDAGIAQQGQPAPQAPTALATLLEQLAKTDSKAWLARKNAMVTARSLAQKDAQTLRAQAKAKHAEADKETARAKKLVAESEKLNGIRATIAQLSFVDPAAKEADKKSARSKLQSAIARIQKLPVAAWDARIGATHAKAKVHKEAAAKLSATGKALTARANKQDQTAKGLDQEIGRLAALQRLVGDLEVTAVARSGPAKPSTNKPAVAAVAMAAKKPAPKKPAAKKPAAKKPAAKKPAPKKPAAKKPAPKKPAAKKPAAKKPAAKKPAPKKPAAKKPAPKKPAAKKPAPKKPAAKKPAPKKPAAKKPAAKKPAAKKATPPKEIKVEADKDLVTYEAHVYPIFDEYCMTCHDPSDASGGLDLSTHATAMQGGSSGRTLSPGDPDASRLYLLVSHKEKPTMPPDEDRIDDDLIQTIRTWIQQGAPKDLAHAKKLAIDRANKRRVAAAKAREADQAATTVKVIMPADLPKVQKAYPPRPGSLRALAASPGAPLLAVPGFHQILLMHEDGLRELGVLDFPYGQVECLSFSPDGSTLIAAGGTPGQSGGAILFDVRSGKEIGRYGEQRDALLSAAVSTNGALVAVGDTRRRVSVTRVSDGRSLWREQLEDWATALAFSPNGQLIATADRAGFVIVREAENGREAHSLKVADGLVADIAFSPDSTMLATTGADRSVTLYRMRDGRRMFQQKRHSDQVLCVAWRTKNRLISSGADGRVMQWLTNGNNEAQLPRLKDWVYDVATSHDGERVYTADWLGRLTAIDVKSRKVLATITPLAVTQ